MSDNKQISKAPEPISPVGGSRPVTRRIHYQPHKAPDWTYWPASRKVWQWQAVALSLNIDPESLRHSPDGFVAESFPSAEVEAAFKKRLDLLANCILGKSMMSLSKFTEWAASVNLTPMPSELAALENQSPPVVLVDVQLPATEQAKSAAQEGSGTHGMDRRAVCKVNRAALDITTIRGCPRSILEHWDMIEQLHGQNPDGLQVLRVIKRNTQDGEKVPALKTVQNKLSELRGKDLIP